MLKYADKGKAGGSMFRTLIYDKSDESLRAVMACELGYSEDLTNLESDEIENLFGAEKQQGLWICTYDNAIVNFYGLNKETCTELIRKAFVDGCLDLTEYVDCEWIYPEEDV